eukprot:TRINITY_DN44986_c0_g3_i2.p2 TRINITY_DN44986_c0_g3~~TRINITY_DN44986_c0_g3_i2.p2  ORF type:complete len:137 (-),score=12.04 TRINITY_DN44986_c0_g3_i2:970-1380(-)
MSLCVKPVNLKTEILIYRYGVQPSSIQTRDLNNSYIECERLLRRMSATSCVLLLIIDYFKLVFPLFKEQERDTECVCVCVCVCVRPCYQCILFFFLMLMIMMVVVIINDMSCSVVSSTTITQYYHYFFFSNDDDFK